MTCRNFPSLKDYLKRGDSIFKSSTPAPGKKRSAKMNNTVDNRPVTHREDNQSFPKFVGRYKK